MAEISHPDIPFTVEVIDPIGGRILKRYQNGGVEPATSEEYLLTLLVSKLAPQESNMGSIVNEHTKQVAELEAKLAEAKAKIAELEAQLSGAATEVEEPEVKKSRK